MSTSLRYIPVAFPLHDERSLGVLSSDFESVALGGAESLGPEGTGSIAPGTRPPPMARWS